MQFDVVYCPAAIEDKLLAKHAVTVREVRQVLLSSPRIRLPREDIAKVKMSTPHLDSPMAADI